MFSPVGRRHARAIGFIARRWGNVAAISVGPVRGAFGEQSLGSWALQLAAMGGGKVSSLSGQRVLGPIRTATLVLQMSRRTLTETPEPLARKSCNI